MHMTHAKSLQSCPTLCDPIDGSPPGSPIPGILQARTLEWVAISFSSAWKWKVKLKSLSRVRLFATPWTTAHQAPLSMGFFRQEFWGYHWLLPSNHGENVKNRGSRIVGKGRFLYTLSWGIRSQLKLFTSETENFSFCVIKFYNDVTFYVQICLKS